VWIVSQGKMHIKIFIISDDGDPQYWVSSEFEMLCKRTEWLDKEIEDIVVRRYTQLHGLKLGFDYRENQKFLRISWRKDNDREAHL
jgi:hypothetical protein